MDGETAKFTVEIILSTDSGELPSDEDVERMIVDQMHGELDEETGLAALAITLISRSGELS